VVAVRRTASSSSAKPAPAAIKGLGDVDDGLGFSFKKLVKGAIKYSNPIGLSVAGAKLTRDLARKTSIGRGIFNTLDYVPGGQELNKLLGGGGGGGKKAAPPKRKAKPKKKIALVRPAGEGAPSRPLQEDAPPEPEETGGGEEELEEGGGDEGAPDTGEGGEDEGGSAEELAEDAGGVDGMGGVWSSIGKGLKSAGKAVGKVGLSVGKTALETYIGRPISGGQSAGQQAVALQKAARAPAPFYKNPLVIGAAVVGAAGLVYVVTRKKR